MILSMCVSKTKPFYNERKGWPNIRRVNCRRSEDANKLEIETFNLW